MPGPLTRPPRRVRRRRERSARTATAGLALAAILAGCSTGPPGGPGPGGPSAAGTPSPTTSPGATTVEPSPTTGSAGSSTATSQPSGAELAAIASVLRTRAAALVSGDEQAYAATVADGSSAAGRRQLAAFRAARALRVSDLRIGEVTGEAPTSTTPTSAAAAPSSTAPGATVRVRAEVAHRLADLDRGDRTGELSVVLRADGAGGWSVVSESATAPGAPAWVVMPGLVVRRGEHAVVAGTVPASRLADHVRVVDRSLPELRRLWARTPHHVLVLAPGTVEEAAALLGRPAGSGAAPVGATTEGPSGADGRATGDRVVLDPVADGRLTASGRDVVLTHELAHVAVRATVPGRPAGWLAEGYADHVGYARADVPTARLLEPLLADVRAGHGPAALPRPAELDPGAGPIEVPYLASWQAVELLVQEHGEAALRRLVVAGSATGTEADAEAATDRALQRVLGTTRADLTRAWQQRLRDLAR